MNMGNNPPAAARGILWDMDGVLVDTGAFHFQAWMETLHEFSIPFDQEIFTATFGMNNMGVLTILLGRVPTQAEHDEISGRKETTFRRLIHGAVDLLPGVRAWLEYFNRLGVGMAVASSAPVKNIDALVDELHIRPYFQAIISAEGWPSKPDPYVFLTAAQALGVLPENSLVVEDAVAGVEAARRAQMRCLAVTTTNPAEKLRAADRVVERLDQLTPADWEELFQRH